MLFDFTSKKNIIIKDSSEKYFLTENAFESIDGTERIILYVILKEEDGIAGTSDRFLKWKCI